MPRVVRVYDPNRRPAEWTGLLSGPEVAVFVEDALAELPLKDEEGHAACEIFVDIKAAEIHCRSIIAVDAKLRCLVFDAKGRGGEPLAVYESPRLRTQEISGPFRRWFSIVLVVTALALIWFDWSSDFDRMWPSILAWKFLTTALVFITWEATLITQRWVAKRRAAESTTSTNT